MAMFHLLAAILLAIVVDWSESCSCKMVHYQEHYCSADFVMKVRVRSEEITYRKVKETIQPDPDTDDNTTVVTHRYPINRRYNLRINKIFKIKDNDLGLDENSTVATLQVPYESSMCGISLETKDKYLITGHYGSKFLQASLCEWVHPWQHLSIRQKKNIHHLYGQNCDCEIRTPYGAYSLTGENRPMNKMTCTWPLHSKQSQCYNQSACIRDKNDSFESCKWHRGKQWRTCNKANSRKRGFIEP